MMLRICLAFLILICGLTTSSTDTHSQVIPVAYYRTQSGQNDAAGLRFRNTGSTYFSRTPTATGSQTTYTISAWLKLGSTAGGANDYPIFSQYGGLSGSWGVALGFNNSQQLRMMLDTWTGSSGMAATWTSTGYFRDPNAWYHVVAILDTTQATQANRFTLYVNGALMPTTFGTVYGTFSQGYATTFGNTSQPMRVGGSFTGTNTYYFDGYMSDVSVVDGLAVPPSAFGETDVNGTWIPKVYTGGYGVNGFRLDFSDASALTATTLGKDRAGSNNYTPNNFSITTGSTYDPMYDSPRMYADGSNNVGNYTTWNPLNRTSSNIAAPSTGNLELNNGSSASTWPGMGGSMAVSSGKWYYETAYGGAGSLASSIVGFAEPDIAMDTDVTDQFSKIAGWYLRNDSAGLGDAYTNFGVHTSYNSGADAAASGTMMFALDMDNNKFWLGRGGTWYSGNPSTNTGGYSFAAGKTLMPFISPCCQTGGGGVSFSSNFGQTPFTYTVPTGFKAWNTYNLPNPLIAKPTTYMKIATYTGNGLYQTVGDPVKLAGSKMLSNSMRFRSASSTYLTRTGTAGNRRIWTWSGWVKRAALGTNQGIFTDNATANTTLVMFNTSNQLLASIGNGTNSFTITSTAIFNDVSAWHHIVWAVDTTQATASLRNRLYVDGVEVTTLTSPTYPAQNYDSGMNNSTTYQLGRNTAATPYYSDVYLADVYFLDGQQLTPTTFGEYDANNNWAPKATSGLAYGTNGFHLDFSDSDIVAGARSGYDSSGNNNHFSAVNLTLPKTVTFASGSSAYMTRTGTAGNQQKWTWSGWIKRNAIGTNQGIFDDNAAANTTGISFNSSNQLQTYIADASNNNGLVTTPTYTDMTAWYHIVWAVDTTQATPANRNRLYVNGSEVTTFASVTYPAQNFNSRMNAASTAYQLGRNTSTTPWYSDQYMSDVYFVDGQQLDPTSFAQTVSGKWVPKLYSGTYGTNGFHLDFSNKNTSTTLGADTSGNNNNFTTNNLTTSLNTYDDILSDTPTPFSDGVIHGNYATLNPMAMPNGSAGTLSFGNLTHASASNGTISYAYSTMGMPTNSKIYFEMRVDAQSFLPAPDGGMWAAGFLQGITTTYNEALMVQQTYSGACGAGCAVNAVTATNAGVPTNSPSVTTSVGDIIQYAIDTATGYAWVGRNGTWLGSGSPNPATGTSPLKTFTNMAANPIYAALYSRVTGNQLTFNFGQRPFAYTMPTGYRTLNTFNISPTSFTPDLMIVKNRSATVGWKWYDRLRGATLDLDSSSTGAQGVSTNSQFSFQNGGFTAGSNSALNTAGNNYVTYMFKKGVTPGFDIVTYTGTGTTRTVNHSLGAIPSLMILKKISGVDNWDVYHASLGATKRLLLNSTNAQEVTVSPFNNTEPTSSVFTVKDAGDTNESGYNYVAYLFAEVPGFSKFGSFVGNGNADGTFVYTGFKPALVMTKAVSTTSNWLVTDYARDSFNMVTNLLRADTTGVETGSAEIDYTANGFKYRGTSTNAVYYHNVSGVTYIYAAFAEKPFKYTPPSSGTFTGGSLDEIVVTLSNSTMIDLSTYFSATDWASAAPKRVVVPTGVTIGSTSSGTPALRSGTGWGGTLTLQVDAGGTISGAGGASGGNGGTAVLADAAGLVVNNAGTIRGGGGSGAVGGTGGQGGAGSYYVQEGPRNDSGYAYWYDSSIPQTNFAWGGYWSVPGNSYAVFPYVTNSYTVGGWTYYNGGGPMGNFNPIYRIATTPTGSTGGAGGAGGLGGRGQGYDGASGAGSAGSAGIAGTNNAGNGGAGGNGGTGGSWGASGTTTGATAGSAGTAGNAGSGAAGGAVGSAGLGGWIIENPSNATFNNTGTAQGR